MARWGPGVQIGCAAYGLLSPVHMVLGDVNDFEEASARVLRARTAPILYLGKQLVRNLTGYADTALEPHKSWVARISFVKYDFQSQTREDQRLGSKLKSELSKCCFENRAFANVGPT